MLGRWRRRARTAACAAAGWRRAPARPGRDEQARQQTSTCCRGMARAGDCGTAGGFSPASSAGMSSAFRPHVVCRPSTRSAIAPASASASRSMRSARLGGLGRQLGSGVGGRGRGLLARGREQLRAALFGVAPRGVHLLVDLRAGGLGPRLELLGRLLCLGCRRLGQRARRLHGALPLAHHRQQRLEQQQVQQGRDEQDEEDDPENGEVRNHVEYSANSARHGRANTRLYHVILFTTNRSLR